MNIQILDNILKTPDKKIYGNVVKPLGGGAYQVIDDQGKTMIVDSSVAWDSGAGVSIKDGIIIGTASNIIARKTYQV